MPLVQAIVDLDHSLPNAQCLYPTIWPCHSTNRDCAVDIDSCSADVDRKIAILVNKKVLLAAVKSVQLVSEYQWVDILCIMASIPYLCCTPRKTCALVLWTAEGWFSTIVAHIPERSCIWGTEGTRPTLDLKHNCKEPMILNIQLVSGLHSAVHSGHLGLFCQAKWCSLSLLEAWWGSRCEKFIGLKML